MLNKRLLLIPSGIGLSHLIRLLLIARRLLGHVSEVGVAFSDERVLETNDHFKFFLVPEVKVTDFSSNVFAEYTQTFVEQCVEEELKAIKAFQPDAIVGDFRPSAAISARVAGVPYISVVNAYMTDYFDPVDVMIPKEKSAARHAIASIAGKAIQAVQKRALASPFRAAAKKFGLKDLVSLYDFLKGDLTLIADLPQFCPLENLPSSYRYIGPLIWEGNSVPAPRYLENRDPSRPLIYATTGNTGEEKLVDLVVESFKEKPCDVVITTGEYIHPRNITGFPNIHIEKFIPGSMVLKHATVAIHCGGNGTTYQVISHGVPAVVLPFNNDQKINAWLIKRNGLGLPLSTEITGNQLRLAAKTVIEDSKIREKLSEFQKLLANVDGAESATNEISSFLEHRGSGSSQATPVQGGFV